MDSSVGFSGGGALLNISSMFKSSIHHNFVVRMEPPLLFRGEILL